MNPWLPQKKQWSTIFRWAVSQSSYSGEWRDPLDIPRVTNDGASFAVRENSASVTWVGHSTFVVHDDDDIFLTDPQFNTRALIPKRHHPPGVPISSIPGSAFAVVSHNHYDHLDAYTVETLPDSVTWFVPMGLADWFRKKGRKGVVELNWWQTAQHGRWKVTCVPVQHWSQRIEQGQNSTLWCGWVISSGERTYYFGGDTGYFHGFTEVGKRFGPIDVAMIPIGAYEPRWIMRYSHLNPREAYQAFLDLKARWMVPCHWGTFDLTDEPIDEPPRELRRVVEAAGGSFDPIRVMAIGERWEIPETSLGPILGQSKTSSEQVSN
ncbi:MAG: MBL fold metallo-hydrolase [Deltaproteobacteria bacterium]|nr:MBL fold metallo-hydrolase [Deltaproteobacteria bacterium]